MKLLDKTTKYFIGISLLIFCLGGMLFYYLFLVIIDGDINNKLQERKEYIVKQLEHSDSLVLFQRYSANMLGIVPVEKIDLESESLSDTTIFDAVEDAYIDYRQLTLKKNIKGKAYVIHVRRGIIEHKELLEGVVILEALLFAALVLILTLVNNQVSKKIWKPFYFTLDKITHYKVDLAQSMKLPMDSIDEFNELSAAIEKMSVKINREFNIQKEFSESASHEIQTPLAIVRNKLEILMQSDLTKDQMELINSATVAVGRLSKLNEALIILYKIDNRQFHDVSNINVAEIIEKILDGLDELIKLKSINVIKDFQEPLLIKMHPFLCEILLENLIVNSVKHNLPSGEIVIKLNERMLQITNTGEPTEVETEKLFQRFVKSNSKSQSLGLGLSIVKAICETYTFPIKYSAYQGRHSVTLTFDVMQ
ncbi:MAG: HAMP domain-containing sensor histidine kinase [Cyclobacteriaceae bacterium]